MLTELSAQALPGGRGVPRAALLDGLWQPGAPHRAALRDGDRALTAGELAARVDAFSDALTALRPHALGIALDNGIDWIVADLGAMHAGIPVVPLPGFFSPAQAGSVIEAAGLDALVAPDAAGAARLGFAHGVGRFPGAAGLFIRSGAQRPALPEGTAKITFTSGTTGQPKGVCLSTENQFAVAASLVEATAGLALERHLCLLPLPVLLENIAGVYAPLAAGAEVIVPPLESVGMAGAARLDVARMVGAIGRFAPHSVILVPQMLKAWVYALRQGAPLPADLRFVAVGGGKVAADLLRQARELGLPAYEGYGLSECASVVSLNRPGTDKPGTVGRVLAHLRVRIAGDGEILVGGNAFLGYLGAPGNPDPVIATGDLGRFDGEGYLVIEGRKKNVVVTAFGRNVSPEWPEAELTAQPAILQAAVFGEARANCSAVLVAADPRLPDAALQAAVDTANRGLPDYARIGAWVRAPEPFSTTNGLATANGRPRRDAVWDRFAARLDERCGAEEEFR